MSSDERTEDAGGPARGRARIGRRAVIAASTLGAAGAVALNQSVGAQGTPTASAGHPVVGSWIVDVTFQRDAPIDVTSLITYGADGTVLVANAGLIPGIPAGTGITFTESHGAWAATGDRSADATFVFLTIDQVGAVDSINTVHTSVEVDDAGNAYVGGATVEARSAVSGTASSATATFTATKIVVGPGASSGGAPTT